MSLFICRMKYQQPVVQNVKLQTASRVEFWTAMYVYGEHDSKKKTVLSRASLPQETMWLVIDTVSQIP